MLSYVAVFIINYKIFVCLDQADGVIINNNSRKEYLAFASFYLLATFGAIVMALAIVCIKYDVAERFKTRYHKILTFPSRSLNYCLTIIENCPPNFKNKDKENK